MPSKQETMTNVDAFLLILRNSIEEALTDHPGEFDHKSALELVKDAVVEYEMHEDEGVDS